MAPSVRATPDRTPSRPAEARRPAAASVRLAARRAAAALAAWTGRLGRLWRRSLQFRVVTLTVLLSVVVVVLLGSYLFSSISDGLEKDRIASSQAETARLREEVQNRFDQGDAPTASDLNLLAQQAIGFAAAPSGDNERYLVLTRSLDNTNSTVVQTVSSGRVGLESIPTELRQAVRDDPRRQQVVLVGIQDPQSGATVPAVLVGSRVELPTAGRYDLYAVYPMQREQATLALITRTFTIGGLALVFLVGAVALVVTRQVVSPVRRAAIVAERLSSGRLNERMRARGEDDLALLAKSFNEMADSLQSQIRQLEGLSRVQQRFVSDVSHELRTPLTTIRMAVDLIHGSRSQFEPAVARSAELLHAELDRFEELLADLLEISRFDAGAAALDLDVTDLRDTVARAVESARPLAARWGSAVTVTAASPCDVEMDARRVERILRNLVVNAVEHGEGKAVDIAVAANDSAVAVTVRDHGVGLRPGEAALVFNRFWRADPARARTTGGTGLGLAISLEDARLHDGWLQAWGEPGGGSSFRLTLPRRAGSTIAESPLPLRPVDAPPLRETSLSSIAPLAESGSPRTPATRHTATQQGGAR